MNAPPFPPFPSNPAVGQTWMNWTWNGCQWVSNTSAPALRVLTQVFPASAPYMPSAGLVSCVVECIGAGGGGGGVANPQAVLQYVLCGGGGGSGGYSRVTLQQAQVLGGVVVTIGQGGLVAPNAGGGQGGVTSFGAFCVANGGYGGQNCDANTAAGIGGAMAPVGIGDVTFRGAVGASGIFQDLAAGAWFTANTAAGGQLFGGNSVLDCPSSAGIPGIPGWPNSGAGGSGAIMNQFATGSFPGGIGASGFCIVTEYCWADATGDPCCDGEPSGARVAIGSFGPGGMRGFDD
jgi:hypothetical protein